jgi:hypothetical protein
VYYNLFYEQARYKCIMHTGDTYDKITILLRFSTRYNIHWFFRSKPGVNRFYNFVNFFSFDLQHNESCGLAMYDWMDATNRVRRLATVLYWNVCESTWYLFYTVYLNLCCFHNGCGDVDRAARSHIYCMNIKYMYFLPRLQTRDTRTHMSCSFLYVCFFYSLIM